MTLALWTPTIANPYMPGLYGRRDDAVLALAFFIGLVIEYLVLRALAERPRTVHGPRYRAHEIAIPFIVVNAMTVPLMLSFVLVWGIAAEAIPLVLEPVLLGVWFDRKEPGEGDRFWGIVLVANLVSFGAGFALDRVLAAVLLP